MRLLIHVRRTVSCCFAALRQLRHLRRYVTDDCLRSLVVSLVHSRLDYGNSVLVRLPAYLQRRLQSVLNAAARLVFRLSRYDHVSDALQLYIGCVYHNESTSRWPSWHFVCCTVFNDLVRVADLPGRRRLRSSSSHQLRVSSTIPAHNRRSTHISSRCIAPLELIAI